MSQTKKEPVRLADYTPFGWHVEDVALTFTLDPKDTRVRSLIRFVPNEDAPDQPFRLDGENLRAIRTAIDGTEVDPEIGEQGLTLDVPDGAFTFEAEVSIAPEDNLALEGLYMSKGLYCTQCEAEGFRRITWYPDRPDVMATFRVRIEGNQPVRLSNGNEIERGDGYVIWEDPWPKPSYLFALVAGDLVSRSGSFTTMEGRDVALNIWTRKADQPRSAYALDALIRSMKWDEEVYGRAYDLDVFNLVSVDDFSAGAMENKGLNIFNSSYTLASPETATDRDYAMIEGVVAHEYFHNWTGNRITCRDWFQLCLKEGLTVFRDQQFSGDMRSASVKRIDDVLTLRAAQFPEDAGPLAHPVRPEEFFEINNFYTATVYEKGAEVIRMLKLIVGDDAYREALGLYFSRHDGDAATVEDWLKVFEDATGRDLSQFALWYSQAGTPRIAVEEDFNDGTYRLTLSQAVPPTPGQTDKKPMHIPVALGILNPDGTEAAPTRVLELTEDRQSFDFDGLAERPIPSLLRGYSAPVILDHDPGEATRLFLMKHDTDPFNRWEAARGLSKAAIIAALDDAPPSGSYLEGLASLLCDDALDPAFRAFALRLPSEEDVARTLHEGGRVPDPSAIRAARDSLRSKIGAALSDDLARIFEACNAGDAIDPVSAGRRSLRLAALGLLTMAEGPDRATELFAATGNMTESIAALELLVECNAAETALTTFETRWQDDAGVMDKWFAVQVGRAGPDAALQTAATLSEHRLFTWKTPNRFRALIGAFGRNQAAFHHPSGKGYAFVADWLIRMDAVVPQVSARTATLFDTWRRYDRDRQDMMHNQIKRILATGDASADMTEILTKIVAT